MSAHVRSTGGAVRRPRAEWAAIVRAEYELGDAGTAIARRHGLSSTYVYDLLNDPTGEKARGRKDRYRQPCPECGTPMTGSNGVTGAPERCLSCSRAKQQADRKWTAETVVAAIQRWARLMGRPPKASDWRASGFWEDADGMFETPSSSAVYGDRWRRGTSPFQAWAAAIEAAGFPRPRPSAHVKTGATVAVRRLVADGAEHRLSDLCRAFRCSDSVVLQLAARGELERVAPGVYRAGPNLRLQTGDPSPIPASSSDSSTAAQRAA